MRTKQSERTAKIADIIALYDMRVIAHTVVQPAPFRVNRTKHDRMNDPGVTVANLGASEVFITGADPGSNHSQVMAGSLNVSAGDVLRFNASKGNPTELDYTATVAEMCAGGFAQNATIECGEPAGICWDVDDATNVDMTDAMTTWYDIADCPTPGAYVVNCYG
ncbi:MAG: hypothetical protein BA874_13755 [Desulfuromonadales bacterium C00003068]|nr:MAG: hypothetical protein BA874_13755 [Desulfuromonadales bacterium C00003068]